MSKVKLILVGILLVGVGAAIPTVGRSVLAGSEEPEADANDPEIRKIEPPIRHRGQTRPDLAGQDYPQRASVPPVALELQVRLGKGPNRPQAKVAVVRSATHLLVDKGPRLGRWMFRRNPVAPAQMSACRIDLKEKVLVDYTHSELRHLKIGETWAQLVDRETYAPDTRVMRRTGKTRRAFDLVFNQYKASEDATGPIQEVWWNEELRVPLEVSGRSGEQAFQATLVSCRREPGPDELKEFHLAYPQMVRVDYADLEELIEDREALEKARLRQEQTRKKREAEGR